MRRLVQGRQTELFLGHQSYWHCTSQASQVLQLDTSSLYRSLSIFRAGLGALNFCR